MIEKLAVNLSIRLDVPTNARPNSLLGCGVPYLTFARGVGVVVGL